METNEGSFGSSIPPEEKVVQVVGFGRRLVAYLVDAILLMVVGGCLGGTAGLITGGDPEQQGLIAAAQCLISLIAAAYFIVFWGLSGATPGKMAMGIKIVTADGALISWGKAVLRYLGYIVSGIVIYLGFVWIAFDAKRQGWHDKIANTYVVPKETSFSPADRVRFVPSDEGSPVGPILAIGGLLLICVVPIAIIALLTLMGPAVGDVFSDIIRELETP